MLLLILKRLSLWCKVIDLIFLHFLELFAWCRFSFLCDNALFLPVAYICDFRSIRRYVPRSLLGTHFAGGERLIHLSHKNVFFFHERTKDSPQRMEASMKSAERPHQPHHLFCLCFKTVSWKPMVTLLYKPRMRTSRAVTKKPWEQKQKTRFSQRQRPSAAIIKACFALWGSLIAKCLA